MAYKQKGSPFQRNFGIGSPAKQTLQPRVAPVAAPMGAPAPPPQAPPVDPAMIAQAAEAVKGAMAPPPPPVDPGAEMPPPTQRNLRMEAESPMKFIGMIGRMPKRTKSQTNAKSLALSKKRAARGNATKPMSIGVGGFGGGGSRPSRPKPRPGGPRGGFMAGAIGRGTTGSVNKPKPTTGGPRAGIIGTTSLPGGDNPRKRSGRRRGGLLRGLARGVKSIGKSVRGSVGSGMSGIAKTAKVVKRASNLAKGVRKKVGGLAKGVAKGVAKNVGGLAGGVVKNAGGLARGVAKTGLGGAVKLGGAVRAVKPVVKAATGIAKGARGLVSKVIKR